jgi:hypothetical protein
MSNKPIIAWWSAGVTSAVACKLIIDEFGADRVRLIYFKIDSAHPDNERFIKECEAVYGKKIEIHRSAKYTDQFDVASKTRYINGPNGARCTLELKKNVRYKVEEETDFEHQVFGFEYDKKEINRAIRFIEQYPVAKAIFPLIENKITKPQSLHYLENVMGIQKPAMYSLGYSNNNCLGCLKGGAGYWNKIRIDFPETFAKMAKIEREIGNSCLKNKEGRVFLDQLDPNAGRHEAPVLPDCGNFCDIEFSDIPSKRLEEIYVDPRLLRSVNK